MPSLPLTPLSSLQFSTHTIPSHALLPNSAPHGHPLFIYHSAFPPSTPPAALEAHLRSNGLIPQWRYTMYPTTHFHSTTHEILCVYGGRAKLLFGGEENPGKVEVVVKNGDAIIVPAGVGHRLLEEGGAGEGEEAFMMVGAYPSGCAWDMCYGREEEGDVSEEVKRVQWLNKDPLYGDDGPVLWSAKERERRLG